MNRLSNLHRRPIQKSLPQCLTVRYSLQVLNKLQWKGVSPTYESPQSSLQGTHSCWAQVDFQAQGKEWTATNSYAALPTLRHNSSLHWTHGTITKMLRERYCHGPHQNSVRKVNDNEQMLSHCTGLQTRHSSSRVRLFTTHTATEKTVLSAQGNTQFIFLNGLSSLFTKFKNHKELSYYICF